MAKQWRGNEIDGQVHTRVHSTYSHSKRWDVSRRNYKLRRMQTASYRLDSLWRAWRGSKNQLISKKHPKSWFRSTTKFPGSNGSGSRAGLHWPAWRRPLLDHKAALACAGPQENQDGRNRPVASVSGAQHTHFDVQFRKPLPCSPMPACPARWANMTRRRRGEMEIPPHSLFAEREPPRHAAADDRGRGLLPLLRRPDEGGFGEAIAGFAVAPLTKGFARLPASPREQGQCHIMRSTFQIAQGLYRIF